MPVFLLFDFVKLLSREDSKFNSGNIASSGVEIYSDIEDLNRLEFDNIYHRGSTYHESNPGHITYCRHAEVLIPDELDIYDYLEYVLVRSEAEVQTLLYGLNTTSKEKLKDKIRIHTNGLFYADRFYVEDVVLEKDVFRIAFSKSTNEKFDFTFKVTNHITDLSYEKNISQVSLESKTVTFKIKPEFVSNILSLEIRIDGNLAYAYRFEDELNFLL